MRQILITLLLSGLICWISPVSAAELGYVLHNGVRLSVEGQKSIWSASRRTVTVYLLSCPYRAELLENWSQRDEFLTCHGFPPRGSEALAAKFVFHLSNAGHLERLELRTRGRGRDAYQPGFRRVWKEAFPVRNLSVTESNELVFDAALVLPDEGLLAIIKARSQ